MENAVNFVPSIQLVSEPNSSLIHKAGFFHSNATGQFFPIKRRPAFTERLRSVSLAHATVLTAVNQQAAFCLLESTQSNNAYHTTSRPRHVLSPGQAYHSFSNAERTARNRQVPKAAHPKVQSRRKGAQAHGFFNLTSHTFSSLTLLAGQPARV